MRLFLLPGFRRTDLESSPPGEKQCPWSRDAASANQFLREITGGGGVDNTLTSLFFSFKFRGSSLVIGQVQA